MLLQRNAPCRDCKNRHEGCHVNCKIYKDWKTVFEEEKSRIRAEQEREWMYRDDCTERRKHFSRGPKKRT